MAKYQLERPKRNRNIWDTNRKPSPDYVPSDRHKRILDYVWEFGVFTIKHLMWLESVSKRRSEELIEPLWHNGYVNRPKPKVRARHDWMFFCLTKKGAEVVAQRLNIHVRELDWVRKPRMSQIDHDARINDIRIILLKATATTPDIEMVDWIGETTFNSWRDQISYITVAGNKGKKRFVVDAYAKFVRHLPDRDKPAFFRVFPELELSPKSNPRFADHKILPARAYLKSEICYKRLGSNSGRYLFIVDTPEKMDNYRSITERAIPKEDYSMFYFTSLDQINEETILFTPIWWRAGDRQPLALFK